MNSQFIRTFADDLSDERKKHNRESLIAEMITTLVMNLHALAHELEKGVDNEQASKDTRK